jgi:hypothetical protein
MGTGIGFVPVLAFPCGRNRNMRTPDDLLARNRA